MLRRILKTIADVLFLFADVVHCGGFFANVRLTVALRRMSLPAALTSTAPAITTAAASMTTSASTAPASVLALLSLAAIV